MSQGNSQLKNLAARKQLLVVESEINRHLLAEDARALGREVRSWRDQAASLKNMVSMGMAFVSAVRSGHAPAQPKKRSWFAPIMDTVKLGTSLWSTFRNGKGQK